uniref:Uncharacterized protein n=1 Tax=Arundo donax TaxID=35708 RepID=A0A0A9F033_ARUDO
MESTPTDKSPAEQKTSKQHKMMDVNTDEVTRVSSSDQAAAAGKAAVPLPSAPPEARTDSSSDVGMKDAESAPVVQVDDDEVQVVDKVKEG